MLELYRNLRPLARVALFVALGAMPYFSVAPSMAPPDAWDSVIHLGALAFLAVVACIAFASLRARLLAVLGVFLFSAVLEYLQFLNPPRSGSLEDLSFNAVGCVIGTGLFLAFTRFRGSG